MRSQKTHRHQAESIVVMDSVTGSSRSTHDLLLSPSNSRPARSSKKHSSSPYSSPSVPRRPFSTTPRGYDWIASQVDRESTETNGRRLSASSSQAAGLGRDDEYFQRLNNFRHANHQSCFAPRKSNLNFTLPDRDKSRKEPGVGEHDAIHPAPKKMAGNYRLDSRLLPTALHHGEPRTCTLCNRANQTTPQREKAYVCVSFPRSSLKASGQWSAARKSSGKSLDEGGAEFSLSHNCKDGWQNSQVSSIPPADTLSLSSACGPGSLGNSSVQTIRSLAGELDQRLPHEIRHSTPQLLRRTRLQGLRPSRSVPSSPVAKQLFY